MVQDSGFPCVVPSGMIWLLSWEQRWASRSVLSDPGKWKCLLELEFTFGVYSWEAGGPGRACVNEGPQYLLGWVSEREERKLNL